MKSDHTVLREAMASTSVRMRRRGYPSPATIKRLVSAAQECGIPVAGFEVTPDGGIRVYERSLSDKAKAQNEFDRWEGQL